MDNLFATDNSQPYFIIYSGEDGIDIEGPISKDKVLERIETDWYGQLEGFYDKIPECNTGYFSETGGRKLLIIQGKIVIPKEKIKVTKYEL